ncbi:very-long-chain aldehyde decarbonylase CER1-like [Argentina anserina]|uniref:very-long-chain aldehyde decarbonylase CER1-like n=1 Tax=Argentina anserina TaxID=57926 RepID=UPI00217622FF|nr:very-long-chain aldehyde decarbonylase CER1-like [Potentilla anserina]
MASTPGILTDWPWTPLGSFKYVVLAPWVIHSTYSHMFGNEGTDLFYILVFPFLLWRMLHNQVWISLSRYQTARGKAIVDKGLEFEQVDRERDWDDQIIFNGMLFYLGRCILPRAKTNLTIWRGDGLVMTMLLHAGPVEYLYYWLHRALHHHFLYSRYHSHHHSSIVTEPITSVTHPFAEHITYFMLFAIPMISTLWIGTASITSYFVYITYIDFMNNLGHCNFEFIPNWIFSLIPPLKYLIYTPSYHSLHHTQFRTNYSLFMPIYDYMYGTMDKCSETLHESSLRKEESPDVVHLTHLPSAKSIYQLPVAFASLASKPHTSTWYLWLLWPVTLWSMMLTRIFGGSFVIERQRFDKHRLQTWVIPKYSLQYSLSWKNEAINRAIEDAILEAAQKGAKVISLGLLNQGEGLNSYGGIYVQRNPRLKIKVVDGSSFAVAVTLNSIPKGTTQVILTGNLTKVAYALAFFLCQRDVQVVTLKNAEYLKLTKSLNTTEGKVIHDRSYAQKIWLVGDGLSKQEQLSAPKGTIFIPFSQFPPKQLRRDCFYHHTPAMKIPKSLENVYSCENWLPRRVMSAWRIAGIVHALEDWNEHECGDTMSNIDKVWKATLRHGFQPLISED